MQFKEASYLLARPLDIVFSEDTPAPAGNNLKDPIEESFNHAAFADLGPIRGRLCANKLYGLYVSHNPSGLPGVPPMFIQ